MTKSAFGHVAGTRFVVTERLALTEDDQVVREGDPRGRWLYAIPGHELDLDEATARGLTPGDVTVVVDGVEIPATIGHLDGDPGEGTPVGGFLDDVPTGSAPVVLDWVNGDRARAQAALEAESHSAKPRKALTAALAAVVAAGDDTEED